MNKTCQIHSAKRHFARFSKLARSMQSSKQAGQCDPTGWFKQGSRRHIMNNYNGSNSRNSAVAIILSVFVSFTLLASAGVPKTAVAAPAPAFTIVA
jgi:hypothetical protein